jgi:hypothetical protein
MYVILRDRDQALTWLERAYEAREATLATLTSPRWDFIRDDPRFLDLARRASEPLAGAH